MKNKQTALVLYANVDVFCEYCFCYRVGFVAVCRLNV